MQPLGRYWKNYQRCNKRNQGFRVVSVVVKPYRNRWIETTIYNCFAGVPLIFCWHKNAITENCFKKYTEYTNIAISKINADTVALTLENILTGAWLRENKLFRTTIRCYKTRRRSHSNQYAEQSPYKNRKKHFKIMEF